MIESMLDKNIARMMAIAIDLKEIDHEETMRWAFHRINDDRELLKSIKEKGQLEPVIFGKTDRVYVKSGHRRYLCLLELGETKIIGLFV